MLLHPVSLSSHRTDRPTMSRDPLSRRAHWSAGQPISYLMHLALQRPQLISLAAGFVDQHSLPADATKQAMDAMFGEPATVRAALQYGTTHGFTPLRETILHRLLEADGGQGSKPA